MKRSLFAFAILATVCLIASSAFANGQLNAGNTTMAAELVGPTLPVTAVNVNTAYQTAGPIAASTVLTVTLTNGKWANNLVQLCSPAPGLVTMTGAAAVDATNTIITFTLINPLATGTVYSLQPPGACASPPVPLNNIQVAAGSLAGTVLSMTINSSTVPNDPNVLASATVLTLVNQFTAVLTPVTSRIDFANNLTTFVAQLGPNAGAPPQTTAHQSEAGLFITSNDSLGQVVPLVGAYNADGCGKTLPAGDGMKIKVTGNFAGLGTLWYNFQYAGTIGVGVLANLTPAVVTAGSVTLTLTGAQLDICKVGAKGATLPDGNTALALEDNVTNAQQPVGTQIVPGTFTDQMTLTGGGNMPAGYTRDIVAAGTVSHVIQLNVSQFIVPYLSTAGAVQTFCTVNNPTSATAAVTLDVLSSEASTVQAGLALGTVPAMTTLLATFNTNQAQLGSQAPVTINLPTTGNGTRYSGRININAPPGVVSMNCIQTDPVQGPKRLTPVLTPAGQASPNF